MLNTKTLQPSQRFTAGVARQISRVSEPLLLVGSGVAEANIQNDVMAFATQQRVPVVSTIAVRELIPKTHPLFLGVVDTPHAYDSYGFDWADLVIAIGCSAAEAHPHYWNPDGDLPILHIHSLPAEINDHYTPQTELVGDLSTILLHLMKWTDRQTKPPPHLLSGSNKGHVEIHSLSSNQSGDSESYTLRQNNQQMPIPPNHDKGLSIQHFRTNRLHVVQGNAVLVVLQNCGYDYIPLNDREQTMAEIPPGVPYDIVNLSSESCLVVNSATQHGASGSREYGPLRPPIPYDVAEMLRLLMGTPGFKTQRPMLRAL